MSRDFLISVCTPAILLLGCGTDVAVSVGCEGQDVGIGRVPDFSVDPEPGRTSLDLALRRVAEGGTIFVCGTLYPSSSDWVRGDVVFDGLGTAGTSLEFRVSEGMYLRNFAGVSLVGAGDTEDPSLVIENVGNTTLGGTWSNVVVGGDWSWIPSTEPAISVEDGGAIGSLSLSDWQGELAFRGDSSADTLRLESSRLSDGYLAADLVDVEDSVVDGTVFVAADEIYLSGPGAAVWDLFLKRRSVPQVRITGALRESVHPRLGVPAFSPRIGSITAAAGEDDGLSVSLDGGLEFPLPEPGGCNVFMPATVSEFVVNAVVCD